MRKIVLFLFTSISFLAANAQLATTLSLNGSSSNCAAMPTGMLNGAAVFTIEFWVKTTENRSSGTYWQKPTLIGWANPGYPDGDFGITTSNGYIGVWGGLNAGGDQAFESSTVTINDNNWHHIAAVNDGTTVHLFTDGIERGSISSGMGLQTYYSALAIGAGSVNFGLGGNSYGNTNFFHQGVFSEIRVSNSVRYTASFTPASNFSPDGNTVALYHFDNNCGVKSEDASANDNDLTINIANPSCNTLPFASDFTFNGTNQYALMPAGVLNGASVFTIEGWIKSTDLNISPTSELWRAPTLIGIESANGSSGDMMITTQGGYLTLYTGLHTSGDNWAVSKAFVCDDQWHHFAVSANGSAAILFVDGVNVGSLPINRGLATSGGDALGMMANNTTYPGGVLYKHSGELDEVRVSSIARYATNFIPPTGPFSPDANTVALYHLNTCANLSTPDASGNNNHATIKNFVECTIPQVVKGKNLYSHHNALASTPDSIYVLESDGTTETFITLGFSPRLSKDGRYLAFSSQANSYGAQPWIRDLYIRDEKTIFYNNDYLTYYDFAPHNSKLIYSQECFIYSTNLDGSNAYQNVFFDGYGIGCWNDHPQVRVPDSMIVFHNLFQGLRILNYNGSGIAQVPNTGGGDLFPIWSPDGQWLAYYKHKAGAADYIEDKIYKIKPDGSGMTALLVLNVADTLTPDPVWSKDLSSVSFIGRINGTLGLYEVKADGSGNYRLIHPFSSSSVLDYWLGATDSLTSLFTLPLKMLSFTGQLYQNGATLKWETSEEVNTSHFEIQRSGNAVNFIPIGTVQARSVPGRNNYEYFDNNLSSFLQSGYVFYRLKMVDKDGKHSFSNIIKITIGADKFTVYPNPGDGIFFLQTGIVNKKMDVLATDVSGREVYHGIFYNTSLAKIHLPAIKGIYQLKISADRGTFYSKVVIGQ